MTARSPSVEEELHHAWGLLLDQADTIADSITLTLFERDSDLYERIGPEFRADVRGSTRRHIRRGLQILAGQRQLGTTEADTAVELWRETGRRRARQGVPLELVLGAYTLGARVLWEALVARAGASARVGDAVLLEAAKTVWSNLDVQSAVLIDAYRRESARLQRQDLQRQQALLDGLLEGRGADPEFAEEARAALDIGPDDAVACVVLLYDGADSSDALAPAEDRLDRMGVTARWHVRAGVYYGLLSGPLPDEDGLVALFAPHVAGRMGVAASPEGIAGFATAFQLATRAAETLARGEKRVVSVTERLPEVLLVGSPQVAPLLLAQTLGPVLALPEAQSRTLVDTLAALLRHDGSPTHAAEELFCHRNTVIYRMKQIEQLTGRTLTDPRDKMLLGLALMARHRT